MSVIVDGRNIAKNIYDATALKVAELPRAPKMAIITCTPNFETQKYLELKKEKADQVGISLTLIEVPVEAETADVIAVINSIAPQVDGIVVQLPLPQHMNREEILAAVPANQDPDCFSEEAEKYILPPVVGAIAEIATAHDVNFSGKKVVVLGHGRLVGEPAARYAKKQGAEVTIVTKESTKVNEALSEADIIIAGVGQPNLVTANMVKSGVIVFDAGTSEEGGELRGDVHREVAEKAAIFTPVPGGIGPITIAVLLRNLVALIRQ